MEKYDPKSTHTIRISNLTYGLMKWFFNDGQYQSCKRDEALFIDQRVFGPATAKGLIATDGVIWYLTDLGKKFVMNFESRSAWKQNASSGFSHYIKLRRSQLAIVARRKSA